MELRQTIAASILENAAILAVLGWPAKSLLEKLLARDSKRFELELKSKTDQALEAFKSQLQLRAMEHQVKLTSYTSENAGLGAFSTYFFTTRAKRDSSGYVEQSHESLRSRSY